jgi:prepilin-type N-terminal cleavage/methylation domain-containing protein
MSAGRDGFSLIEVIVAMVILSVGILAMGSSIGYVLTQVRAAEVRTDRMTAVHQVAEQLRTVPWDALENACSGQQFSADKYTIECTVTRPMGAVNLKRVELVSTGPGLEAGRMVPAVVDTMTIGIARPIGQ